MDPQAGSTDQIIGQTVGNYLVTQKLGEGGMGSVYLAEHPTIGKKVALKILHAEFSTNPEVAERFFTEAKSVNAIGHPNIVDIVDYGVLQSGPGGRDRLVYFIMEYLHGVTLSQVIRTDSPLAPERALTIALQVADALSSSHKASIVHRDLKPDNIILITRGREHDFVKLLDFGIAKLTGSDGLSSHKTRTGLVLGTPAYMSPEQCEGRATVDHRTDVYALGVVLYEMICGRVPFIGEGYGEILVQHLTQQPVPPSQYRMMSPHLEQVVLKALEKRPEMRYPDMDEFIRAMSDPVGFVESHGGVGGFLARQLIPSTAALPHAVRLTPQPLTPVPGMMTPPPGTLTPGVTPSPTTLGAAAGQVQPQRSRTPFFIAAGLVVALTAGAVFFILSNKKSEPGTAAATGSQQVQQPPQPPPQPPPPSKGSDVGSAAVATGSATGSAVTAPEKGSAVTPPTHPDVTLSAVSITSTPSGADILINGAPIGKKTPSTLQLPKVDVTLTLRLKGYEDMRKALVIKDDKVAFEAPLKQKKSSSSHSTTTGKKGSGTKSCDTCLERPD